ncbi:Hypothetical_protein [Hexamita inflata]|uniref:Hypothetical_protein n=1 Tax=Hexamita inflata TaxID=28002 RepID=A0AA86UDM0_9EUKA|nr:Hypothetical protein HINF_LOCUS5394 [Hexamita inflata]CAI9946977.1 Hypothetical protein HINF_LOCUS34622 [Hexamita inflata]
MSQYYNIVSITSFVANDSGSITRAKNTSMPLKVIQTDKDSVTWHTLTKMTSECLTIQSMCIHDVLTSMNSKCWVKSYQTMRLQVLFSMRCLENKLGFSLYSRQNNERMQTIKMTTHWIQFTKRKFPAIVVKIAAKNKVRMFHKILKKQEKQQKAISIQKLYDSYIPKHLIFVSRSPFVFLKKPNFQFFQQGRTFRLFSK